MNRLPKRLTPYLFLAPLVLFLAVTLGYPLVANLVYSLSEVDFETIRSPELVGFQNYRAALQDEAFWGALAFSGRFAVVATLAEVGLGLLLALALEPLVSRHKPLLAVLLLPLMVAPVLMGIMYRLILNEFVGLVPQYLSQLGVYVNFLVPPYLVSTLVTIEVLQWTPFAFLILYTALQNVPLQLYEAAKIDGGTAVQLFRHITLPFITPALAITAFVRFIDAFRVFDHIFVLTGGGPGRLTTSISIYIYKNFFQQELIGQAVAASVLLLILALIPLFISMRFVVRAD